MPVNPSSFRTTTPLENFSVKVINDLDKHFAGLKLFTPLMVSKSVGSRYQYKHDHLRLEKVDAPSGSEARTGSYGVFTNTYTCLEKAWKTRVLEKDARDADRPVSDFDFDAA